MTVHETRRSLFFNEIGGQKKDNVSQMRIIQRFNARVEMLSDPKGTTYYRRCAVQCGDEFLWIKSHVVQRGGQ